MDISIREISKSLRSILIRNRGTQQSRKKENKLIGHAKPTQNSKEENSESSPISRLAGVICKNILMSEVVASAVIGEAVSRISTFLIGKKNNHESSEEDGMERLEMAHIRMEASLEVSSRWPLVTDASLLRWRKKLKRASDECSLVMDRCKRRAMEDDETEQEVRRCSFPKRIAHATTSFLSSFIGHKNVGSLVIASTIQRFERFADGAGEFLRFMEFGSIGSINYMLVDPLIGYLLAGKALQYERPVGNQCYLAARPMRLAERGQEAGVLLRYNNHERPEESFVLGVLLRVTESMNVIGIVARCLESLPPNFKLVAESARRELKYWRIHHTETHHARPSTACCEHHDRSRNSELPTAFPEPVIKLFVQCHVSARQKHHGEMSCSFGDLRPPLLQLTAVFAPHASAEELPPGAHNVATVAIDGKEEEEVIRTNVGVLEVEEFLMPNAVDRLCHEATDDGSSAHEVFWRSSHGVAYLCVERMGTEMVRCRPTQWRV
uniref:Uncharacterized protein n=1 Tax=Oryza brachyantha TaxID=4533 RepID=J3MI81_ORYBR